MNNALIYPEIFNSSGITAFFTGRTVGIDKTKFPLPQNPEPMLYMPVQRHTNTVIIIRKGSNLAELDLGRIGDAVVTDRADVVAGVRTADCVPILLYDSVMAVAGAVHAGWRGTGKGILKAVINIFIEDFGTKPKDILIAFGPSIRGCCYVVGEEVVEAVTLESGKGDYITEKDGRPYVDLVGANTAQALSLGVRRENIWTSGSCTFCDSEYFFSFRKEGTLRGSQGAFISASPHKREYKE
ncbi:peptidoglycan editing factor PgeF [Candidatus Magnetominusculus xianensis]|uniref:Purine nucleoside phosphorylase n=1 Tax=Candidatus Magnetominusculus xianensis TaxID=1748249 RepID=A0ABR5SC39_9BACT|nr:peptidoglycan editing factor PgeF [Candidatus Magnetominusculus xianensis]KWT75641.1 laccase domain protein [Candidatus Magnetominusculus xianensis]MBF0403723.1 peptidoglycan editing factor PgeF [Nitrospirota bacterium]